MIIKSSINLNGLETVLSPAFLVIPTVEGRATLTDTLESLQENLQYFDKLIISYNGRSSVNLSNLLSQLRLSSLCTTYLYCTDHKVSAINHLFFITQKLKGFTTDDTLIYLLADDDLMIPNNNLKDYLDKIRNGNGSRIGMGNFQSFSEHIDNLFDENQHIQPGEEISPLIFLQRNSRQALFTNMSSMVVPFRVLSDAITFMKTFGSAGRRFEYILATHKGVHSLYSPFETSVLVRNHPGQEQRTLSPKSEIRDEFIYVLWVWINQPLTRPSIAKKNNLGFTALNFLSIVARLYLPWVYSFKNRFPTR